MDPSLNRRMPAEFVDDDLRAPPGWYTAQCCDAWLAEDHQEGTVPRPTLRGEFTVHLTAGLAAVRFKMSPEEWRWDLKTKRAIKVTEDNRASLTRSPLDNRFRLWCQALGALRQQGATAGTAEDVKKAIREYPLRFKVDEFKTKEGHVRNYVGRIDVPQ